MFHVGAGNAFAWFDPLSRDEKAAEAAFVALCLVDWRQTLEIAERPDKYREINVFLGDHPTARRVNTLIPLGICAHAIITYALPRKYRKYWQYMWIGVEIQSIHTNWRSGIAISF